MKKEENIKPKKKKARQNNILAIQKKCCFLTENSDFKYLIDLKLEIYFKKGEMLKPLTHN